MNFRSRAPVKFGVSYRLGHYLIGIADSLAATVAFSILLAIVAAVLESVVHDSLKLNPHLEFMAEYGDQFFVGLFVFLLTAVEFSAVRERRLRLIRDMKTVSELNHHIRNSLEAIQYAAYTSSDKTNLKVVNESVAKIDQILRDLFPHLKIPKGGLRPER
jgi:hypothetical protein